METEIYSILFKAIWQKNCVSRLDHFGSLAKKKIQGRKRSRVSEIRILLKQNLFFLLDRAA
jgi:hypothetical protein